MTWSYVSLSLATWNARDHPLRWEETLPPCVGRSASTLRRAMDTQALMLCSLLGSDSDAPRSSFTAWSELAPSSQFPSPKAPRTVDALAEPQRR